MLLKHDHFELGYFEGSLDFLLCLLQKEEIEISDISIQQLIHQFLTKCMEGETNPIEKGAEFIHVASYLVWLKSQMLLTHNQEQSSADPFPQDPTFAIIHHLIDYNRFKRAAKALNARQERQQICYFRGKEQEKMKKPLGIDHLSLEELGQLFKEMMHSTTQAKPQIPEEIWRVKDKIDSIREWLQKQASFPLNQLFSPDQSRLEMIVIFLALLELMKNGELVVGRHTKAEEIKIFARNHE